MLVPDKQGRIYFQYTLGIEILERFIRWKSFWLNQNPIKWDHLYGHVTRLLFSSEKQRSVVEKLKTLNKQ